MTARRRDIRRRRSPPGSAEGGAADVIEAVCRVFRIPQAIRIPRQRQRRSVERGDELPLHIDQRVDGVPPARRTAGRRVVGALGLGALPLIVVMLSNRGVRLFAAAVRHASTIDAAPTTFVVPGLIVTVTGRLCVGAGRRRRRVLRRALRGDLRHVPLGILQLP